MSMVDEALKYARREIPVFPVNPDNKAPCGRLVPNGVKNATTDEQKIRDWWRGVSNANVGLACGEIFVIDLDVGDGKNGIATWKAIQQEETVPPTTVVHTPSGGRHLYYRAPEGVTIKNSVSDVLGDGVDVRGHGGYVLAPPSSLDAGSYTFDESSKGIADAPFWLVSKVRKKGSTSDASNKEVVQADDTIPKGQRNDKLTSMAGYFRRKGLNEDELTAILHTLNESRCSPPVDDEEVERIASSVARYDPSDAGSIRSEADVEVSAGEEVRTLCERLLSALYHAPEHGPVVVSTLPDPEALPNPWGAALATMIDHGLSSNDLDRARVDLNIDDETLQKIKDPADFNPTRWRGETSTRLVSWANALRNQHTNAGIAKDLRGIASDLEGSNDDPADHVATIIDRMQDRTEGQQRMITMQESVDQARETLSQWIRGETAGYMHTWPTVDDNIGGFDHGEVAVIAGFTSGYKTASMVDLCKRIALRHEGEQVYIPVFSAEMKHEQLTHRIASNVSGVSVDRLRPDRHGNQEATDEEIDRYDEAMQRIRPLNLLIDECSTPSYERMLSHCLQVQALGDIPFVAFDYVEKMDERGDTEELRVSNIIKKLKRLAKQINRPVVALSQYSRQNNAHAQWPQNYYLRYSGKIEQEAAQIIHWYYPKYFVDRGRDPGEVKAYDPEDPNAIYAICGKNRSGEVKNARLWVDESTGRIIDRHDDDLPASIGATNTNAQDESVPF